MADEPTMSPIADAEPPKANPLAKPAAASSTLKLQPIARPGAATGATPTATGLRPGLKLPPKPGLASGLKLPPKPGMPTATGLKPGLKLPPKPGLMPGLKTGTSTATGVKPGMPTATGLKPGLKLPPKPVIRKPGSTVSGLSPLARPVPPKAPTAATPVANAEESPATLVLKPTTDSVAMTPVEPVAPAAPATAPAAAPEAPTAATVPAAPAPASQKPMDALKSITRNLKSITAPIPQQAILHKTGIIADPGAAVPAAAKEAAKSATARISLSEAIGSAPVSNDAAPMKTIRIKRPIDIPGATKTGLEPQGAATPDSPTAAPSATATGSSTASVKKEGTPTITQRKTLKIARPGAGTVRPSGKFGAKPSTTGAPTVKVPKPAAPASEGAAAPAESEVADIPDIPDMPAAPAGAPAPLVPNVATIPDVPKGLAIFDLILQAAACAAVGVLIRLLVLDYQLPLHCGGCQ